MAVTKQLKLMFGRQPERRRLLDAGPVAMRRLFGQPLRLDEQPTDEKPKWQQLAYEGVWLGHPMGEVNFTRELFQQIINNFHAHPWYQQGETDVIPLDYHHASEVDPTSGDIAVHGAPAPGWVRELEIRDGTDGKAELWGLVWMGEQLRQQVKKKEFRSVSVAVWLNFDDPVTGNDIGPFLSSVAITNQPFIEGMEPLAATRKGKQQVRADLEVSVWGTAENREELIIALRSLFQLPDEADAAAVVSELTRFQQMVQTDTLPEGVDSEWIMGRVREIVGAPLLSSVEEVIAIALRMASDSTTQPDPETQVPPPDQTGSSEESNMTLADKLATIFNVRDNDDAIIKAAQDAAGKADEAAKAESAVTKLKALVGSTDVTSLLADVSGAMEELEQSKQFVQALQQALDEANKQLEAVQEEEVVEEVEAIAASMNLPEEAAKRLKPLIEKERRDCFDLVEVKSQKGAVIGKVRKLSKEKLDKFRQQYPLPENWREQRNQPSQVVAAQQYQYLAQPVLATNGAQLVPPQPAQMQPAVAGQQTGLSPEVQAEITMSPGRNTIEKSMSYLASKYPQFRGMSRADQVRVASAYYRTGQLAA